MSTVKGSKLEKLVVVPYRPWRRLLWQLSTVLGLMLALGGGYYLGQSGLLAWPGGTRADSEELLEELTRGADEITRLRQLVIDTEQAHAVDRQSLDALQHSLLALRQEKRQLEEDVLFYRQVLAPDNQQSGLAIGQFDLFATADTRRFRYRAVLRQLGGNEAMVSGHASIQIIGEQAGEERVFDLRDLDAGEDRLEIALRFRYFQNIEGELALPPGFLPHRVRIKAVSEGSRPLNLEKSFGWLVQDQ